MTDVTKILSQIEQGDASAAEQLMPLVYDELRKVAVAKLAKEKPGQTLQATALVNEAYIRLVGSNCQKQWNGRAHFCAAAAEAMRRILVESARRKRRAKHGGGMQRLPFDVLPVAAEDTEFVVALNEALEQLQAEFPESARVVELRFFGGMTVREVALAIDASTRTVERHWAFGKAWLFQQLRKDI